MNDGTPSQGPPTDSSADSLESLGVITNSFVVTIRSMEQRTEWRGSVEHVQTRERIYFLEWGRLTRFIAARSGILSGAPGYSSVSRGMQSRVSQSLADLKAKLARRIVRK